MKRIITLAFALVFAFSVCSCGGADTSSELSEMPVPEETLYEEAALALYNYFGTHDKETGKALNFSIIDSITVEGVQYFHGRLSVLETNDDGAVAFSKLKNEFFLSYDYSSYYEGTYDYIEKKSNFSTDPIDIRK